MKLFPPKIGSFDTACEIEDCEFCAYEKEERENRTWKVAAKAHFIGVDPRHAEKEKNSHAGPRWAVAAQFNPRLNESHLSQA